MSVAGEDAKFNAVTDQAQLSFVERRCVRSSSYLLMGRV